MAPKNPHQLRINEILREMVGKYTTHQICMRLDEEDLHPPMITEYDHKMNSTRNAIERFGQGCQREGEIQERFLNLTEQLPDGTIVHFYKKPKEFNIKETVQGLVNQEKIFRREGKKLHDLFDVGADKHGKAKLQRLLPFRMPEREAAVDLIP